MKALLYITLATGMVLTACHTPAKEPGKAQPSGTAATVADSANGVYPEITFEKESHNFGDVVAGEVLEYSFKFTNTGKRDLVISKAEASCGCTVPEWPKEPIKPGESRYMKVKFDSKGRPEGYTEKEIFVHANTNPAMISGPRIQCNIVRK